MLDLLKMGINSKITNLDGQVAKKGDVAQAGGVFSDVWLGEWLGTGNVTGQKVGVHSCFPVDTICNDILGCFEVS